MIYFLNNRNKFDKNLIIKYFLIPGMEKMFKSWT